jgi:lysophospholipase
MGRMGLGAGAAVLLGAFALLGLGCAVTTPPAEGAAKAYPPEVTARAGRYLAALPPLPEGWRRGSFAPEPGVVLEVGTLPARGARRGTAVVVPGFTAPLELHADEYARLAGAGWDVAALSQRGQGRSTRVGRDGRMGHIESFDNLARDLGAFVAAQEGPVVAMGISMGAHTVLRLAAQEGHGLAAVAAVVPMVAVQTGGVPLWQARLLAGAMDRAGLGQRYAPGGGPWTPEAFLTDAPPEPNLCTDDPARAHLRDALFLRHPELRVASPSMGWLAATLRSQARLAEEAGRIDPPLLLVTVEDERLVDNAAASSLCEAAQDCRETRIAGAMHCLLEGVDPAADRAMKEVLAFLAAAVE